MLTILGGARLLADGEPCRMASHRPGRCAYGARSGSGCGGGVADNDAARHIDAE